VQDEETYTGQHAARVSVTLPVGDGVQIGRTTWRTSKSGGQGGHLLTAGADDF
jgi:hypothetical protein